MTSQTPQFAECFRSWETVSQRKVIFTRSERPTMISVHFAGQKKRRFNIGKLAAKNSAMQEQQFTTQCQWKAVWDQVTFYMDGKVWEGFLETTIRDAGIVSSPRFAGRRPDGIVRNRKSGKWLLFDFTRGTTIQQAREGKIEYYAELMQDLQAHEGVGRVVFYPMVSTFRCSIEEREWSKALVDSGLVSSRQLDKILAKAMEQLFKGIDFMARTRAVAERLTSEPQVHSVNSVNSVNSVHSTNEGAVCVDDATQASYPLG